MKFKFISVAGDAPKLLCTAVLSAFLVACGGGGSSDNTDDGTTDGTDGDILTGGDTGGDTGGGDGFDDLELGDTGADSATDSTGTTDLDINPDPLVGDTNGNGIPDVDEPCEGRAGTDPASTNYLWSDNCQLQLDINRNTAEIEPSPFANSTYSQGVQRVLYCRGHGGVADSIEAFADGKFGSLTDAAVREFQEAEGLVSDGIVGERTWGKMQELVETIDTLVLDDTDADYSAYGVLPRTADFETPCTQLTNFFGKIAPDGAEDRFESWELAVTPGENVKGSFSIAEVQP